MHSEEAAIINAAKNGISLDGSTFYITGEPCHKCLRMILSVGAAKIVYGNLNSRCIDEEDKKIKQLMLEGQSIEIVSYASDLSIQEKLDLANQHSKKHRYFYSAKLGYGKVIKNGIDFEYLGEDDSELVDIINKNQQ